MIALFARSRRGWLFATALLLAVASSASAQYSYEVDNYHTYVSNGAWWVHAAATNNTDRVVRWRISYSARHCTTWSGAVSMMRAAGGELGYNQCRTTSTSLSHSLAPYTSAALLRRDVSELNYYEVRKYDTNRRRLVATGFATEHSSFQEYAFSDHY